MLWAYEAQEVYEVYEVQELNFRESVVNAFHRCGLLPPPRAVPLPRRGRSWGVRRSRPSAVPSIGYRGFAVAPMTLRAPSRWIVVITSGINGRAMRAPTGDSGATVAMKQPSVANASHRFDFRHVVGARIARPPTLFKPSIFYPKDLPHRGRGTAPWAVEGVDAGGGRSSFPSFLCRTSFYFPTHSRHTRHKKHKKHMKHKSRFS